MSAAATIRLFYAIEPDPATKEQLETACSRVKRHYAFGSWTHPSDYHVTVKFLGDVAPHLSGELEAPIRQALIGAEPFELTLSSFGAFGKPSAPSVLWCGLAPSGIEPLRLLHRRVELAAASIGLPTDERPFRPHITAARRYRGAEPMSLDDVNFIAAVPSVQWKVQELVLFRTRFGQRPAYEALNRFQLGIMQ